MVIRACPRCAGRFLRVKSDWIQLRLMPWWLEQRLMFATVILMGIVAALCALWAKQAIPKGMQLIVGYLPFMILLSTIPIGWAWWKARLGYGYVRYYLGCDSCGHQWIIEERGG